MGSRKTNIDGVGDCLTRGGLAQFADLKGAWHGRRGGGVGGGGGLIPQSAL